MEIMDKNPVQITEKLQFQAPSRQPAPFFSTFLGLKKGKCSAQIVFR